MYSIVSASGKIIVHLITTSKIITQNFDCKMSSLHAECLSYTENLLEQNNGYTEKLLEQNKGVSSSCNKKHRFAGVKTDQSIY